MSPITTTVWCDDPSDCDPIAYRFSIERSVCFQQKFCWLSVLFSGTWCSDKNYSNRPENLNQKLFSKTFWALPIFSLSFMMWKCFCKRRHTQLNRKGNCYLFYWSQATGIKNWNSAHFAIQLSARLLNPMHVITPYCFKIQGFPFNCALSPVLTDLLGSHVWICFSRGSTLCPINFSPN